ncbi:5-formyltetrahydrofolate cyclo-ligase [Roseivirga sp. E12]|uniref:5-formyltetrahydrofolate cyclo-ligase n=1 Tax=Roseivirga sp. E12 TaxID=2819237 RepID=UPI001ABBF6E0|nr:5-formyltetrahydrofolate cyclo-ligase [Roseivirga sp. E12]MBO3699221.1 5-formyltetrahydrofolate cyclo-ligase [Roseivirga sp. E12]
MNKEVLRSLFLEKRQTLTNQEFKRRNDLLLVNNLNFLESHQRAVHCHIFLPILKFKEPNTWPLFEHLQKSSNHEAYVSKTLFKQKQLEHFHVTKNTELKESKYGIPEPLNGEAIHPEKLDIVFVPLICCDKQGNRVGYGAGLYDRFLQEVRQDCLKIGLGITSKLDNIDYTTELDIPLDYYISHLGIDDFR